MWTTNIIANVLAPLEQRKVLQATKAPIRLTTFFSNFNRCMTRKDQQQAIKWLLPSRSVPPPPSSKNILIKPYVNVKFYNGFRGHRVLE